MINKKLISILTNIALLLEIKGENPFKTRAYSNLAHILEEENIDIEKAAADGTLGNIKGVGDALQKKITEFIETGHISYYDKLIEIVPESLIDLTKISTIGPKKAKMLYEKMGISNLDALEEACINDKIKNLKGFSAKSQEIILNSIQHKKAAKGKFRFDIMMAEAEALIDYLLSLDSIQKIEISGELRRFVETPKTIEFVAITQDKEHLLNILKNEFNTIAPKNDLEFISKNKVPVKLHIADKDNFGTVLHKTTGNREYLEAISEYVNKHYQTKLGNFQNEKELYKYYNLGYIPPELRENREILANAATGNIPKLVESSDMRGMLHVHTNWSDGKHTIEEMALQAKQLGYEYIAITDHSRSASYANGLSIDRIKAQHEEIDRLNDSGFGITILKGIESDILKDGSLDYPDSVLDTFDLVIASVHSHFNMPKDAMSKRIIYALMSPYVHILGHPSGRLLLARPAYELDIEAIIDFAAEQGKVTEINCNPYRLDLSWQNVNYAKRQDLKIAINPDSHNINTLTDVEIGIKVARKGGLEAKDVVNTYSYADFLKFFT